MKRTFNTNLLMKWVDKVGGPRKAFVLLVEGTDMAFSTAEKLVNGRYTGIPKSYRRSLLQITKFSEDTLFPVIKPEKKTS